MKVKEIIEESLRKSRSGKSADICAKVVLCTLIKDGEPFQAIELESVEHLLLMMKDSGFPHVYGECGVFYFSAYYYHDERHPVGRNYFIKKKDLLDMAGLYEFLKRNGFDLPIIPPKMLPDKIQMEGFEKRISDFRERQDRESSHFKGLFEGRSKSTTVDQSIFLNSPGCLVCGNDEYFLMSSTLSSSKGSMFGFNLCKEHMDLAHDENSLIEYLAKLCNQQSPIRVTPLNPDEHLSIVLGWLPGALNSTVEKVSKNTITLKRASGLKGVFRLTSPTNYAYMVLDADGNELARIDSADHHSISYGPDHVHLDLTKKRSGIEPSFTTGSPLIDIKKILEIIAQKEADL